MEATGLKLAIGSSCTIFLPNGNNVSAEVVGFSDERLFLMPTSEIFGLTPGAKVIPTEVMAEPPEIRKKQHPRRRAADQTKHVNVGEGLLGRVLNGLGEPLDHLGLIETEKSVPLYSRPFNPLERTPVSQPLDVGVRAINTLLTVGRGQRMGLFAGSGVGLSGPARHLRWIQLIALFGLAAYAVNLGAVWPFAERLAEGAGVAGPAIPQLLVVSVLFQAMGSVTALVLGRNGRHGRVLLFVMLMQLASQALIWQADGSASLLIGLSLWGASWNLGIAFLLATIAGMPNGSRGLAFVPGVEALGVSLGPMFVAMALSGHLQDTVPMVATTAMLFALAVFLSIDRRRRGD